MPLLTLSRVHLGFGGPPLLDAVSFTLERGERVCLLGRNGEGKSTLLRVVAGELAPEDGERRVGQGARVALLEQDVPRGLSGSVFDVVADGLGELAERVKAYHQASQRVAQVADSAALAALDRAQHALEAAGGWHIEQRTEQTLSRLGLPADADFGALSGGMKRRVMLARALVLEPDLLLLDEPTNHLDTDAITWLEDFLATWPGALLFVTHDRAFLRQLATRILELDRGRVTDWPGDYANYLRRRDEREHAEARADARLERKLSQEEAWIRQGIKARRSRNQGRVRQLQRLRDDYRARRVAPGQARINLQEAERSGRLVVEADNVDYRWQDEALIRAFSTTILRGDRIGIIGPNGVGKTTLLKLLLGELPPTSGRIHLGTRLEVAYFDQLRSQIDESASVRDNVGGGSERISVDGKPRHVISYLQDFLFAPERANQPVSALSGGERNRLLLARLFAQPANVLVLDEPTNDLDIETLELLEERLSDFQGTVLLVSHDREFLDNLVTSTLVFAGGGRVEDYVGGYSDWLRQRAPATATEAKTPPKTAARSRPIRRPGKLSYKDQRELEALPARIEQLEGAIAQIQQRLADPALYRAGSVQVVALKSQLDDLEVQLAAAYGRWQVLEEAAGAV